MTKGEPRPAFSKSRSKLVKLRSRKKLQLLQQLPERPEPATGHRSNQLVLEQLRLVLLGWLQLGKHRQRLLRMLLRLQLRMLERFYAWYYSKKIEGLSAQGRS